MGALVGVGITRAADFEMGLNSRDWPGLVDCNLYQMNRFAP